MKTSHLLIVAVIVWFLWFKEPVSSRNYVMKNESQPNPGEPRYGYDNLLGGESYYGATGKPGNVQYTIPTPLMLDKGYPTS